MRKNIDNKRKILFDMCGGICPVCGRKMQLNNYRAAKSYMTIDHIQPKSMGGTSNIENLRPMCRECNNNRGTDMNGIDVYIGCDNLFHSRAYDINLNN